MIRDKYLNPDGIIEYDVEEGLRKRLEKNGVKPHK